VVGFLIVGVKIITPLGHARTAAEAYFVQAAEVVDTMRVMITDDTIEGREDTFRWSTMIAANTLADGTHLTTVGR
jgi:hypothetical protein